LLYSIRSPFCFMGLYIFYRSPGICRSYIDSPGRFILAAGDYSDLEKKGDCEVVVLTLG